MILNSVRPERVHDIDRLVSQLIPYYSDIDEISFGKHANMLTEFAVKRRYPDEGDEFDILETPIEQIEEALLAFRAFAKEKFGELWVE